MSLLKAQKLNYVHKKYTEIEDNFLDIIGTFVDADPENQDLVSLLQLYTPYSVKYLQDIAETLSEPVDKQKTMQYMNSIIAEVCNVLQQKYFHMGTGASIIDLCIAAVLDNKELGAKDVQKILDDVNKSYEEDIPEEPVNNLIDPEDDSIS